MTQGVTSAVLATLLWVRSNRDNTKKAAIFDPFYTYHLKDVETVFGPEGAVLIRMDDQLLPSVENMETALAGDHTIGAVIVCNPGKVCEWVELGCLPFADDSRLSWST